LHRFWDELDPINMEELTLVAEGLALPQPVQHGKTFVEFMRSNSIRRIFPEAIELSVRRRSQSDAENEAPT